jgi:hypothetical protein
VQPGESPAIFGVALRHLAQSATYLYQDNPRYPTTCDIAYFGGILISMCI